MNLQPDAHAANFCCTRWRRAALRFSLDPAAGTDRPEAAPQISPKRGAQVATAYLGAGDRGGA